MMAELVEAVCLILVKLLRSNSGLGNCCTGGEPIVAIELEHHHI